MKITENQYGDLVLVHLQENPYVDDGLEHPEFEMDEIEQEELMVWFWKNRGNLIARTHHEVFKCK